MNKTRMVDLGKFLGICILLLFLNGCASFKGNMLPKVETFPEVVNEKQSANVVVYTENYLNGAPSPMFRDAIQKIFEDKCVSAMTKSNSFAEVGKGVRNADLQIKVNVVQDGKGDMDRALLSALTLFLIPNKMPTRWIVDATVYNQKTRQEWKFHLEDSHEVVQQLFLLPIAPFYSPHVVPYRVIDNLFKTLVIEMHEAGVFDEPQDVVGLTQ